MIYTYYIKGMSCIGCVGTVQEKLSEIDVVSSVKVNLEKQKVEIESSVEIPFQLLEKALEGTHYSIHHDLKEAQTHTYYVKGMSCEGCENTVREYLERLQGVEEVYANAKEKTVELRLSKFISFAKLSSALEGTHYSLHKTLEEATTEVKSEKHRLGTNVFYCPMHCEGDKTYEKPGDCPICGMDLVEEVSSFSFAESSSSEAKKIKELQQKFWWSVAFTLPIFVIAMSEMIHDNPLYGVMPQRYWNWVQFALSIPVVFYFCNMFFIRAWRSIKTRHFNMFTLIGIGSGVAWLFSVLGMIFPEVFPEQFKSHYGEVHVYFEATTVILTLVMLGQMLEAMAHGKTQDAIKALLNLAPDMATKITHDGIERHVSIKEIVKGDLLRVKPGDKIPVDGVLVEGIAHINESMITGEPIPVDKNVGDSVSAGTINTMTSFVMRAEKVGSETLLAQIVQMVQNASRSQAPIQKLADKISSYFVPIVIAVSGLTFFIWILFAEQNTYTYALVNAIAVLIIACPCALGLATPMSVMVGVGKGAQNGVLIKEAKALEMMDKIDTLVVDKTGTITEGKPSLEKVFSFSDYSEDEIIQLIYSLNKNSEHPLAKATNQYAKQRGVSASEISNFRAIAGKGVEGKLQNTYVHFGNDKLMADIGVLLPISVSKVIKKEQQQGKTISYLTYNKNIVGAVVISDSIKTSTTEALRDLQQLGVNIVMLTGDNPFTAKAVADQIGLKNYKAGMLPQDKQKEIERLQAEGKLVAMAGDGINDAPALAQANIGIAMGNGTDVAIESAEITLVKGDLKGIVKAKKLSKAVIKNIKENLFFALIYNTIGIPIAAGILYPFFGILLSPMLGALAMSFSSVSVIANALRLKKAKID